MNHTKDQQILQRGYEYGVKHFLSPNREQLSKVVSDALSLPLDEVVSLLEIGSIYLNSRRVLKDQQVEFKDYIRVHTRPRRFDFFSRIDWRSTLLFENSDCVILNKPSGLPCHPSVDNIRENVISYMQIALNHELHIVNRLDVPTSGVLVLAKTKSFVRYFNDLLLSQQIDKIYKASVTPLENSTNSTSSLHLGIHTHYMKPSPRAPKTVVDTPEIGFDRCDLEILDIKDSQVKIKLITGRTHQIRAQLSHLGYPIDGDSAYGSKVPFSKEPSDSTQVLEQIALTCTSLSFKLHPNDKISTFEVPE